MLYYSHFKNILQMCNILSLLNFISFYSYNYFMRLPVGIFGVCVCVLTEVIKYHIANIPVAENRYCLTGSSFMIP